MFEKSILAVRPFKLALFASFALAAAGASAPVLASNSATATATADVIVPISITKSTELTFGRFAPGTLAGSVTVQTGGARTSSNVALASGTTPVAASFAITGDGNSGFSVDVTGSSTELISGSDTMALALVGDFTGAGGAGAVPTTGTLSSGAATLYIGGTLTVGNTQAAGNYTGNVSVVVNYN